MSRSRGGKFELRRRSVRLTGGVSDWVSLAGRRRLRRCVSVLSREYVWFDGVSGLPGKR